jgi:hypothetical protein
MEASMAVTTHPPKKPAADKGDDKANLTPATEIAASGALVEPEILTGVDVDHPSVDNAPRKDSTVDMNRVDFNEPSGLQSPEETVEENLKGK